MNNSVKINLQPESYKTLFDKSADAIMLLHNNRFVDCNDATVKLFRYASKEEILNVHPSDVSPPFQPNGLNSREKADKMIEIAYQRGSHRFEWIHKRADGELFFAEVLLTPIPVNKQMFLHAVVRDISEKKRAQQEKERLIDIIENTTDIVFTFSEDYKVDFINNAGKKFFNIENDETKDVSVCKFEDLYPDWTLRMLYSEAIPLAAEYGIWTGETVIKDISQEEIPVSQVIMCHKSQEDKILYFSTVIRDISEIKKVERILRETQKMDSVGRLAGGIAHDFNNLLSAILGYSQFLSLKIKDDNLKEISDTITKTARKASDLTKKLLQFTGKEQTVMELMDIHEIIEDVLTLISGHKNKNITVRKKLSAKSVIVKGDRSELENALYNVMVNAYDAMPGGGTLSITTKNITLDKNYCQKSLFSIEPGKYIDITIKDTGRGIPVHVQQRMFEPFFSTKKDSNHSGLGLASVYGTVRTHRGDITVESKIGKGTAFHLFFPVIKKPVKYKKEGASANEPTALQIQQDKITVLVVDDEDVVREMASAVLKEYGYNVITANDGKEALKLYRQHREKIDIVVLDVVMPNMDGKECLKQLRAENNNLPVILCSAYTDNAFINSLSENDRKLFLKKPYGVDNLIEKISRARF